MIDRVRRHLTGDIARGAIGTFGLKTVQTGIMFLVSLILARLLGPGGYGAYSFAMSWVNLLLILATLGLVPVTVRNIAGFFAKQEWPLMRGLQRRAYQWVYLGSLAVMGAGYLISWLISDSLEPGMVTAIWFALPIVPFLAWQRIRGALMRGLHHVVSSQTPELLILPLLFLFSLLFTLVFFSDWLTAESATGLRVIASMVALLAIIVLCRRVLPREMMRAEAQYDSRDWFASAMPLLWIGGIGLFMSQIGTISVGLLKGAEFTGIYAMAVNMSLLISFAQTAVSTPLSPTIARLHVEKDMVKLQRITTKSTLAVLLTVFGISVAFAITGEWLLSIIGDKFVAAYSTLLIFALGQLISAAFGPVGTLLIMTGDQKGPAIITTVSAFLTLGLNLVLIPDFGIDGAAAATSCGLVFKNVAMAARVHRRLSINTTVVSRWW